MISSILGLKDQPALTIASALILLLAFALRLWGLGTESAWIDEAYSISLAKHGIIEIVQGTAADQHPPLYYILLHFWIAFSRSVFHARFLSLLMGVIHIAMIIHLGRQTGNVLLGLGAGLLLTISPMHVWYSQEIRMYLLSATLTTVATSVLWLCLKGESKWLLYGLFCALAMYTHYFALFVLIAHSVIVVSHIFTKKDVGIALEWGKAMLLLGLCFTPWLPTAWNQFSFHSMPWIDAPGSGTVRDAILRLFFGGGILVVPTWCRWLATGGLGVVLLFPLLRSSRLSQEDSKCYGFFVAWATVPFAVMVGVSLLYPIFQFKQFIILLAPCLLWISLTSQWLPRPIGGGLYLILLVAASITLGYQQSHLTKDDWWEASAYIQREFVAGDLVYGNPAASKLPLSLYWTSEFPFDGYPTGYDIVRGGWESAPLSPELAQYVISSATYGYRRVWFVELYPQFWDPDMVLEDMLEDYGDLASDRHFGRIRIRMYEQNASEP